MRRFYCYDREYGPDAHARTILVSDIDLKRMAEVMENERVGRNAIGSYVEVIDHDTQERVRVASHPCGTGCHCGMVVLPVASPTDTRRQHGPAERADMETPVAS